MDTLRRLFFYTWRYRKLAFLAYGALAGSALLSLVIPRLFGNVVNVVVEALEKTFTFSPVRLLRPLTAHPCLNRYSRSSSSPV